MKDEYGYPGGDIYDRQKRIEGWNQTRLKKGKIALVGEGPLSHFLLIAFSGLGIGHKEDHGHITIYGYGRISKEERRSLPLYLESKIGDKKVEALQYVVNGINQFLDVKGINWKLYKEELEVFFETEDLIIETTNDPATKRMFIEYSESNNKPLISASCDKEKFKILFNQFNQSSSYAFDEFEGKTQGLITSETAAGIISEETRKFFLPLSTDKRFKKKYLEIKLFDETPGRPNFQGKHLAMVGCGAGGCLITPTIASFDAERIDLIDDDIIDPTNLNRQWLFYRSVGERKVDVMRRRLKMINPDVKIKTYDKKFEEIMKDYVKSDKPDVLIDGVDNYKTRDVLNRISLRLRIPLVSGGVTIDSGRSITVYPGKTSCLECMMGISKLKNIPRAPCPFEKNPSVVMSNMVTAGLNLNEIVKVSDPRFGEPFNGIIRYESDGRGKIKWYESSKICDCYVNI